MRNVSSCLTFALALACASCTSETPIHPVSGKVMWKGAPATGAVVFFHHKGGDRMDDHLVMGIVQADGSFELVCGTLGKGAPPGIYDVLIEWRQESKQRAGGSRNGPDRLKGKYADPKRPLFQATVEAKANELAPFVLGD
jgi:hypothetical protein